MQREAEEPSGTVGLEGPTTTAPPVMDKHRAGWGAGVGDGDLEGPNPTDLRLRELLLGQLHVPGQLSHDQAWRGRGHRRDRSFAERVGRIFWDDKIKIQILTAIPHLPIPSHTPPPPHTHTHPVAPASFQSSL